MNKQNILNNIPIINKPNGISVMAVEYQIEKLTKIIKN